MSEHDGSARLGWAALEEDRERATAELLDVWEGDSDPGTGDESWVRGKVRFGDGYKLVTFPDAIP